MEHPKPNTPEVSAEPRIFASLTYPGLVIGRIQFTNGFLVSRDPEEQRRIVARSRAHAIRDITEELVREAPFTGKRVHLSAPDPSLVLHSHRNVEFRSGLFVTEDPDHLWTIGVSNELRTGEIREVPPALLLIAAELAETREKATGEDAQGAQAQG